MHRADEMLGAIKKMTGSPQPKYYFSATVTKPICIFIPYFELHYPITYYHTGKKKKEEKKKQVMDVYQHPFPKLL